MAEVLAIMVDVVDGRRFWRVNRYAPGSVMELTAQIQPARRAGDCQPVCVIADRGFDCLWRLVSWSGEDVSAGLLVASVFALGGFEVRSANRNQRDRVDGRTRSVGRAAGLWSICTAQSELVAVAVGFVRGH